MTHDEFKSKLSRLTVPPRPDAYWQNFWPRVASRLGQGTPVISPWARWAWAGSAALAVLLAFGGGWFWGREHAPTPRGPADSALTLASAVEGPGESSSLEEVRSLFPRRLKWAAVVNGQMDFRIHPTPLDGPEKMVALAIWAEGSTFSARMRLLIRPGEQAAVQSDGASFRVALSPEGTSVAVYGRIQSEGRSAALETTVTLSPGVDTPLGQVLWDNQPLRFTLHVPEMEKAPETRHAHKL